MYTIQQNAEIRSDKLNGNFTEINTTANNAVSMVNSVIPVGVVFPFAGNTTPDGYLLCNGAAISRTTYSALFAVIGTIYGAGNGSTTFNLPNYTDKFLEGNETAGTIKTAGLPNITGKAGAYLTATEGGAIKIAKTGSPAVIGDGHVTRYFDFDASLSNSIYGNSDTVQPPAVTVRYIIKY